MAIYHLSIKIISRGKGKSAVAAAAYRAGTVIKNEYDGILHDYSHKGGVVHTEILLPANAPQEYNDRAVLWNAVEEIEAAKNAQLSREIEIALPAELTLTQNQSLVCEYVKKNFVEQGMCADICIHDKKDGNPHAHIMLTLRPFNKEGTWGAKSRKEYILDNKGEKILLPSGEFKTRKINTVDWNDKTKAETWREAWSNAVNAKMKQHGIEAQIDHRSYERQGLEQIPTVHMGVAASQMERRGIRTERGEQNREAVELNKQLRQLNARINKLRNWLEEEAANIEPPTLSDVITKILERRGRSGASNLKDASKILLFLQTNNITDSAGLDKKLNSMKAKNRKLLEELKPIERRLGTLDEHIKQAEYYKEFRSINAQHKKLEAEHRALEKSSGFGVKRKTEKALEAVNAYYDSHTRELILFKAAENYMKGVLQERYDPKKLPPITKWKEERAAKKADKEKLYNECHVLRDEILKVEQIKKGVEEILRSEQPRTQPVRSQDMAL